MKKKCNVIILTTDKASILHISKKGELLNTPELSDSKPDFQPQHLYITSSDEIKEGDWYYDYYNQEIIKSLFKKLPIEFDNFNKIIASTDPELHKTNITQIGFSFIDDYITEYNKGNVIKEILVEYVLESSFMGFDFETGIDCSDYKPKLRSDNTIIINRLQEVFTKKIC